MDGQIELNVFSLPAMPWPKEPASIPSQGEIAAIAERRDPILRNLEITQTYHELELLMSGLLGAKNVSWCAYATWASRSAGRFIRGEVPGEVLPLWRKVGLKMGRTAERRGGRARLWLPSLRLGLRARGPVPRSLANVLDEVRARVAEGNQMVFAEIAPFFAAFVEQYRSPLGMGGPGAAEREAFLSRFAPGPVQQGGQDMLRRAFGCYAEAVAMPEGKRKAELIFLANALVGYHEQTRLQRPIAGALDAPVTMTLPRRRAGAVGEAFSRRLERSLRALSTRWLIALEMPGEVVCLGEDVPPLASGRMFPDELGTIDDPELGALLYRLDRTPNTTQGSAAVDWADLGDRMHFVVELFRSRQQDARLYKAPFSRAQVAAIRVGRVPGGPL